MLGPEKNVLVDMQNLQISQEKEYIKLNIGARVDSVYSPRKKSGRANKRCEKRSSFYAKINIIATLVFLVDNPI